MGHLLPPPPTDDRWIDAAMPLTDLGIILRLDGALARRWTHGTSRTLLGTTVVVHEPIVRSLPGPGFDPDLPLDGVATLALMHAMVQAGASAECLAEVVLDLDEHHGGPVLASDRAGTILPGALAEASERLDTPSLRRPLLRTADGWVPGARLQHVLDGLQYDEDGWVCQVRLADTGEVQVIQDRVGRRLAGVEGMADASVRLFCDGLSLDTVATVLDRDVAEVEDTLRQHILT